MACPTVKIRNNMSTYSLANDIYVLETQTYTLYVIYTIMIQVRACLRDDAQPNISRAETYRRNILLFWQMYPTSYTTTMLNI